MERLTYRDATKWARAERDCRVFEDEDEYGNECFSGELINRLADYEDGEERCSMLNINKFVSEVGKNAIAHGWWEEERSFGELIALCHSELSEALEDYRNGMKPTETLYLPGGKLKGIPSELADVVIRICDMCHHYGIDLEQIMLEKHEFNKTRPYKHGGKVI